MPEEGGRSLPAQPPAPPALPDEAVSWGFRLLAGREPLNPAEFAAFKALPSLDAMRQAFTNLPEYHAFYSAVLTGQPSWTMPLLLLREPAVPGLDWRFAPPTLDAPGSQLCTASQLREPLFHDVRKATRQGKTPPRELWEQAWIVAMLAEEGLLGAGKRGLALDARREKLPALLAARGMEVWATGRCGQAPAEVEERRLRLFHPEVIPVEDFDRLARFIPGAGNDPAEIEAESCDACWSIGWPARLGSLAAAMEAIERSLRVLKPGGLALHVVGFNLSTDGFTWDIPGLVLLRRADIEKLAQRLQAAGHEVVRLNTHPGREVEDELVRTEQGRPLGLRQRHGVVVGTSFGLAIRKAGGPARPSATRAATRPAAPPPADPPPIEAAPQPAPLPAGAGVPAEAVVWAMRFFAGRDPVDAAEIAAHQRHDSIDGLRNAFIRVREFEPMYVKAKEQKKTFATPAFLLRPPADPALPWRFEQPKLEDAVCQLCTGSQMVEPALVEIADAMGVMPTLHRSLWDQAYIVSVLNAAGLIAPGRAGLGFGCRRLRLPALLASRGVEVLATAQPSQDAASDRNRPPGTVLDLFFPEILHIDDFERLVQFAPLEATEIPPEHEGQFDFCWSTGTAHQLGSVAKGLAFIEASLATLRPGGIAVHATEFNLASDDATPEGEGLSVFRRQDVERLAASLIAQGHQVFPLNFHPGYEPVDEVIDAPPYGLPHLKLQVGELTLTSIGIAIRRKA